jgi:hypothetical protein
MVCAPMGAVTAMTGTTVSTVRISRALALLVASTKTSVRSTNVLVCTAASQVTTTQMHKLRECSLNHRCVIMSITMHKMYGAML